jgi:ankyrin repeat protein
MNNDILYLLENGFDFVEIMDAIHANSDFIRESVLHLKLSGVGRPAISNLSYYVPVDEINRALRWSAYNGHLEIMKCLVEQGADDDEALICSAEYGHLEVVKYLKARGACSHKLLVNQLSERE